MSEADKAMLNRRGFLKLCAIFSGAALLPAIRLIESQDELLYGEDWIATVREVAAYDINTDDILIRHDILGQSEQLSVMSVMPRDSEGLYRARKTAASALRNKMNELGWTVADLRQLPIPHGVMSGDDMLRAIAIDRVRNAI